MAHISSPSPATRRQFSATPYPAPRSGGGAEKPEPAKISKKPLRPITEPHRFIAFWVSSLGGIPPNCHMLCGICRKSLDFAIFHAKIPRFAQSNIYFVAFNLILPHSLPVRHSLRSEQPPLAVRSSFPQHQTTEHRLPHPA